jgi:hypothetical protein
MTYKDNTPTFNVNRKVVNFKDFSAPKEEAELKKIKRQNKPNSERQQLIGNTRAKYNKVTHKMDWNINPQYIEDKIKSLEDQTNESHIDDTVLNSIKESQHFPIFCERIKIAIDELWGDLQNDSDVKFDEGDNDHVESFRAAVQTAVNKWEGSDF